MILRRFIAALALLCAVSPAYAQKTKAALDTQLNASFPDNSVGAITPALVRNATLDIVNSIMPTAPVVSGNQVCFDGMTGLLKDCTTAPILTITSPLVLSGNSLSCPTCLTSVSGALYITSRAVAATLDLHLSNVIQTGGYATAGDGGGATFQNVGTTTFKDSYVTAGSITSAGTGCTNGTYYAVSLTGGTGANFRANVVAAGAVVTTVTIVDNGGSGYTVNDVLTGSITGCTFTWTVSAVSTPKASFSDNVGTHFQYVVDSGNFINARQFGVKADGATDDTVSLQAAINYADRQLGTLCAGGTLAGTCGSTVVLPVGATFLNSATLKVFDSVILRGQGAFNSNLVLGASFPAANDFINLCDPNIHLACFGVKLMDLTVSANASITANNNTWMISSVSAQQTTMLEHVAVYGGQRGCLHYTQAYGGAAKVDNYDFFCTGSNATLTDLVVLDPLGTTNISFNGGLIIEAGGSGYAGNAIQWNSGNLFINGMHTEGIATGINAAASVTTYQASLDGATGGNGCTELVKLQSTNTAGNFRVGTSQLNGCTRLITNGQAGGSNFTTSTVKQITCVSGACS